jgi:hypothetical protein
MMRPAGGARCGGCWDESRAYAVVVSLPNEYKPAGSTFGERLRTVGFSTFYIS